MITVEIGSETRDLEDRQTVQWIANQIENRKNVGEPVEIIIHIDEPNANIDLPVRDCPSPGGSSGGRPLNGREQDIVDAWRSSGLCETDFAVGSLIAFLKQIKRYL
ncbi:hypothetical protein DDZ13_08030 [Coraliomargarita sinensis]|uniref:Uncharacterized protein n=1 Tax=Coraliomargarita sinensis TaxID=2174842 RepID=A0A317ZEV1_9BACT|nr:hypothetical protein DDZ13_08030 [Coraliomargarita sinensis]